MDFIGHVLKLLIRLNRLHKLGRLEKRIRFMDIWSCLVCLNSLTIAYIYKLNKKGESVTSLSDPTENVFPI